MGKVMFMRKGETHSAPKKGLPKGFTKLAGIRATGTQYVDTGLPHKQGYKIDMKFKIVGDLSSADETIAGGITANTGVNRLYYVSIYHSQWVFAYDDTGLVSGATVQSNVMYETSSYMAQGSQVFIVNGQTLVSSNESATFATGNNLTLLGVPYYSGSTPIDHYAEQVYDEDNTLVRDYQPCIDPNGNVGLYDFVTEEFFGNAGTGVFTGLEVA